MNKREIGSEYEEKTCTRLIEEGYEILDRNYYCPLGEIDIIAKDQEMIVFLEVKARKSERYGHPAMAVNYYKQQHIIRTAYWYVKEKKLSGKRAPKRYSHIKFF